MPSGLPVAARQAPGRAHGLLDVGSAHADAQHGGLPVIRFTAEELMIEEFLGRHVEADDVGEFCDVWQLHGNHPVHATRAHECGVEKLRVIAGADQNDSGLQIVDGLQYGIGDLRVIIRVGPLSPDRDGIEFIDEEDAWRHRAGCRNNSTQTFLFND